MVMFYFDKQKVYKEEKPPIPVVSLGEQETQVLLGSYTWNDGEVKREFKDQEESLNYKRVEYRDKLHINFPKEEEPIYLSRGYYGENGEAFYPAYNLLNEDSNFLGNVTNIQTLSLKAFWKNGKRAEYIIPLNVKEVAPKKEYFPQQKGYYSLLVFYSDATHVSTNITLKLKQESPNFLLEYSGQVNIDRAKEEFPELQINRVPSYLLFKGEKEVYRTDSIDALKQFVNENTYEKIETIQGMVTKIDREFGVVYLNHKPYIIKDIASVKVGQKVEVEVAYLSKEISFHREVKNVKVIEEPHPILMNNEWLSNKENKFSLLVVGDADFGKPFKNLDKEDFSLVENIIIKKNLDSIEKSSIFVFNNKELVFQTHDYDSLLKYLFETEQLLPIKKEMPN